MAPGRSKVIPFELEHWILDSLNRFSFFGWLSKQIDYQTSVRVTLSMMQVLELNQCWEISDRCANNFFFSLVLNGKECFLFYLNDKVSGIFLFILSELFYIYIFCLFFCYFLLFSIAIFLPFNRQMEWDTACQMFME